MKQDQDGDQMGEISCVNGQPPGLYLKLPTFATEGHHYLVSEKYSSLIISAFQQNTWKTGGRRCELCILVTRHAH